MPALNLGLVDGDGWNADHVDTLESYINQALTVCTSTTRPGSPTEGTKIWETDTNRLRVWDGTVWRILDEPWQTYTPQIDQGVSTNIAKTVTYSRYRRSGSTLEWNFRLDLTAAGTAGSTVRLNGTPGQVAYSSNSPVGMGMIYDASTSTSYIAIAQAVTTTGIEFFVGGTGVSGNWGATPNIALASGDVIEGHLSYEYVPT